MSGTWPTTTRPKSVQIDAYEPALVSTTQSMRRITRTRGGHRFFVTLEYGALRRDEWAPINAFAKAQKGITEKFTIVIAGQGEAGRGTMAGTPVVDGSHAAGVRTVNIKGLTSSAQAVLLADDLIKFNGHAKCYQVAEDVNADGSGKAAVTLQQDLVAALANNEALIYSSVPMQCSLLSDRNGVKYSGGMLAREGLRYELIEDPYS